MYYFTPASDMFETADFIIIHIELAGVNKEDINIEICGNEVEISGAKRRAEVEEEYNFQRMERPFGMFRRTFYLPKTADRDSINASFYEGLLEIIISKKVNNNGFIPINIEIEE
jgi:HSP20 family protein